MCNEKVGLRPLVCFAKSRYTAVLSLLIYARAGGKDKRGKTGFLARTAQTNGCSSVVKMKTCVWIRAQHGMPGMIQDLAAALSKCKKSLVSEESANP